MARRAAGPPASPGGTEAALRRGCRSAADRPAPCRSSGTAYRERRPRRGPGLAPEPDCQSPAAGVLPAGTPGSRRPLRDRCQPFPPPFPPPVIVIGLLVTAVLAWQQLAR